MIKNDGITIEFFCSECLFIYIIQYNNNCSTVSKLNVSRTDSRFGRVMLLILEKVTSSARGRRRASSCIIKQLQLYTR